jgi:hypothetical protein
MAVAPCLDWNLPVLAGLFRSHWVGGTDVLASFFQRLAEKPVAGFQPPMLGRSQIWRDPERAQIFQGPFDLTQACFEQFQPG